MKRVLPWVLPLLAACSEAEGTDREAKTADSGAATADGEVETATRYEVCNGSEEVRLAILNVGGHVDTSYRFTNPYGWQFLFVTGRCTFIAKPDSSSESDFVTGTFSSEQAETLSRVLNLAPLAGKTYRAQGGCADAPVTQVISANGYAEGACGDEPPALVAGVVEGVAPALELARSSGQPPTGAVEVVAVGDYQGSKSPSASAVAWPFSWPIDEASVVWSTIRGAPDFLDHVRIVTDAEAELARQLRRDAIAKPVYRGHIDVIDDETAYALFVRDVVDPAWQDAIARFRRAYDPYQPKPITLCHAERVLSDVIFDAASLYGKSFSVSTQSDVACGAQLCWDGTFALEVPAGAALRIERPEQPRTCLGQPAYTSLTADLQPLVDAYRSAFPNQAVAIDVNLAGAAPFSNTLTDTETEDEP